MMRRTLKILQHFLQNFQSVSYYFGTLCIKGLSTINRNIDLLSKLQNLFPRNIDLLSKLQNLFPRNALLIM